MATGSSQTGESTPRRHFAVPGTFCLPCALSKSWVRQALQKKWAIVVLISVVLIGYRHRKLLLFLCQEVGCRCGREGPKIHHRAQRMLLQKMRKCTESGVYNFVWSSPWVGGKLHFILFCSNIWRLFWRKKWLGCSIQGIIRFQCIRQLCDIFKKKTYFWWDTLTWWHLNNLLRLQNIFRQISQKKKKTKLF